MKNRLFLLLVAIVSTEIVRKVSHTNALRVDTHNAVTHHTHIRAILPLSEAAHLLLLKFVILSSIISL